MVQSLKNNLDVIAVQNLRSLKTEIGIAAARQQYLPDAWWTFGETWTHEIKQNDGGLTKVIFVIVYPRLVHFSPRAAAV